MLPFHSCYICRTWGSKEVGGSKLSFWGKGKSHKQEDLLRVAIKKLPRELTTDILNLELPTYFSLLWCSNIYAQHKIPSYWNLINKVWINFSNICIIDFLSICKWQLNEYLIFLTLPFLNIFCLMYSLHIPHNNQNRSFFPV